MLQHVTINAHAQCGETGTHLEVTHADAEGCTRGIGGWTDVRLGADAERAVEADATASDRLAQTLRKVMIWAPDPPAPAAVAAAVEGSAGPSANQREAKARSAAARTLVRDAWCCEVCRARRAAA